MDGDDENKTNSEKGQEERSPKKDDQENVEKKEEKREGAEEEERSVKAYLRLILPHVALVLASVLYAVAGAFVFYAVEMRHEHDTKTQSVRNVTLARSALVDSMWNNSRLSRIARDRWMKEAEKEFTNLTYVLYTAFKRGFVKFQQISASRTFRPTFDGDLGNITFEADDYVWTPSSSIFFAWTTMATIGYGNIVPVTMQGRIICVFFALFGTPLAILTIGDLGKFLSESTIAGYKKYKKWRDAVKSRLFRGGGSSGGDNANAIHDKHSFGSEFSSFEDLLLHKAQVPVVVVFAILLIYIALGGILFSFLEGWKYVDAFYFCFISLTTVGFGDMVPKRHAYLVIMLLYIGVGLAVTTMCIDLVGIHYLQKIHYFGRKFKGYDLLKLLRQRRMIERRMAMAAQAADIMQLYFDAVDRSIPPSPPGPKYILEQELPIHDPMLVTASSTTEKLATPEWPIDNIYEEPEPVKEISPISTTPSYYDRLNMYDRLEHTSKITCWSPSGPSISIECSIPTTPSLYERERLYAKMRDQSWPQSPDTFKFEFPRSPSPDYSKIAQEVRSMKRAGSCPGRLVLRAVSPQTPTPLGMSLMEEWDSYRELVEQSQRARLSIPNINVEQPSTSHDDDSDEEVYPPSLLSPLEVDFATPPSSTTTYSQPSSPSGDSVVEFQIKVGARFRETATYPTQPDSGRASLATASESGNGPDEPTMLFHQNLPIYAVEDRTVGSEHVLRATFNCPTEFISNTPPTMVTENYCFVVDGNAVDPETMSMDAEWWKPTSRPTHYYHSEDFLTFRRVHIVTVRGRIVGARMRGVLRKQPSPPPPRTPSTPTRSSTATPPSVGALQPLVVHRSVPLSNVFRVARYYSYWKTCAHFHRIITVITPVKESANSKFKRRIFFQFLWHQDAKEADKLRVAMEYSPNRQAQLLQARTSSFSAAGAPSASPHQSSGSGSNPPSGPVSPRPERGEGTNEAEGPSSSGVQRDYHRRPSAPPTHLYKRTRRTLSIFHM